MERDLGNRLVGDLLRANSRRPSFDINLLDERSCNLVARELMKSGCRIERQPESCTLHVVTHEVEA